MTGDLDLMPSDTPVQLIDPSGRATGREGFAVPGDAALLRAYGALVAARRLNDQAYALVRQGRLAVYPSSHGQEACQVAAAQVLDDEDWLFPTYRDTAAIVARGVDPVEALVLLKGDWHSGYDPYAKKVAPQATPLATQLPHAVGVAHAARLRGESTVVMALCGDGGTSEGDFHEALNFAAVFRAPVVFFVQNNEYAISVPLSRQTAAPSIAHKGVGYGVPGERVDGNDVAALLAVLGDAVARARAGEGPQLVEAHTYRIQAHTNADDATRYRRDEEVAAWAGRDPILRMGAYLREHDLLTDEQATAYAEAADEVASHTRDGLNTDVSPRPDDLFDHVYARRTPQLKEQAAMLADELAREVAR
ncbi:pyruvate dehydrogenase (acetyl-transferring) E1 component subunit alpha [Nocardioides bizhenqiangii]|uniref:Pyruvate dehydrogenase (Acetyl-transferring) E1 component subunit alpha n=1 Tax=Nocardioides bizhenqiangii TaxID=3095076 RepID=A0ABZ0ZTL9_9ACTN|nr:MULTISPECIES: pyruvate dehydrogenase (acetyl-transferring) E1 component subunit alpha [unclassified Nocardioides]MDZ5621747.1 pyruvate dehydrogenase (acetyl-transferring) E1 component subunit alpha [Nocardioides sp. HM23]WQQ27567.1 pyruvate dehydrogenase (acetyl-transferring) E1 component subunit alpha [Nocardioides sp. HM61]